MMAKKPTYEELVQALDGYEVTQQLASHNGKRLVVRIIVSDYPVFRYEIRDGDGVRELLPNDLTGAIHRYAGEL